MPEGVIADAYTFLQQQGCINMGVPTGEPEQDKKPAEELEAFPTDDDIVRALQETLKNADLQVGVRAHHALPASQMFAAAHMQCPLPEAESAGFHVYLEEVRCQPIVTDATWSQMQETTERMVRKQVQSRLGVDVSHRKAFIKEQVRMATSSCQPLDSYCARPACFLFISHAQSSWARRPHTTSRARC